MLAIRHDDRRQEGLYPLFSSSRRCHDGLALVRFVKLECTRDAVWLTKKTVKRAVENSMTASNE